MLRPATIALLTFVLAAVARELEAALGLVLYTSLPDPELLRAAGAMMMADPMGLAGRVAAWAIAGALIWGGIAWWRSAAGDLDFRSAAAREASTFAPLWLIPGHHAPGLPCAGRAGGLALRSHPGRGLLSYFS